MKILYLCGDRGIHLNKPNGAASHLLSLTRAFQELGHELLILTPCSKQMSGKLSSLGEVSQPHVFDFLLNNVSETPLQPLIRATSSNTTSNKKLIAALGHIWNNVMIENALEMYIPRFMPDIIFELYSPSCLAGLAIASKYEIPHVLNVHSPLAWEGIVYRSDPLPEASQFLEAVLFNSSKTIITNSTQMKDLICSSGVDPDRIHSVTNGVDINLFKPTGKMARIPNNGEIVISFNGSLKKWHGIDTLVKAFELLSGDPKYHLLIIGDGPERHIIRDVSKKFPSRVTHTGLVPLDSVPSWLRSSHITLAPYPSIKPFYFSPLKILDGMACGVPVIASRIGQISEIITDHETGLLVSPGDPQELASMIRYLGDNEQLRTDISSNAITLVNKSYSWVQKAQCILDICT